MQESVDSIKFVIKYMPIHPPRPTLTRTNTYVNPCAFRHAEIFLTSVERLLFRWFKMCRPQGKQVKR